MDGGWKRLGHAGIHGWKGFGKEIVQVLDRDVATASGSLDQGLDNSKAHQRS